MTLEANAQGELVKVRSILESQYGVVFLPKTQFAVPNLDKDFVESIVGKENVDDALKYLSYFREYVCDCTPITDGFGDNHTERRKWRKKMHEEFGKAFSVVYENNQLRVNKMELPGFANLLASIAKEKGDTERYGKLVAIGSDLLSKVEGRDVNTGGEIGKKYNEMTLGEKLEVVHFYEEGCLKILELYHPKG